MMNVLINVMDEDPCVTDVLATLLESHGYLTQKHLSIDSLFEALNLQDRSISLVSFGLPKQGASRFLAAVKHRQFATLAVMMSGGVGTHNIVNAIKAGAEDVIEKPLLINELLTVVERSIAKVNENALQENRIPGTLFESLTEDERSIFELMEQGVTIKGIASQLDISVRTVHYRKKSILTKTDCKNRTEAVAKLSSQRSQFQPEII